MGKIITNLNFFSKLKEKNKLILCHGVFDVVHIGHINYFKDAKKIGGKLIVSVTSDKYVNKGPGRPSFTLRERLEALEQLEVVDYVCISNEKTATNIINKIKPDYYCKGHDYKKVAETKDNMDLQEEVKAVKSNKGKFVVIKTKIFSSSKIINSNNLNNLESNCVQYINNIKNNYKLNYILNELEKIQKLNILVLGEIIIDSYVLSTMIGSSGKEPMNVLKKINQINFLGGSGYIANIVSNFSKKTSLLSFLGKNFNNFIKKKLSKDIKRYLINRNDIPSIHKLRFVDAYKNTKLLGVYELEEKNIPEKIENIYIKKLKILSKITDCLIVADFGHGEMSSKIKKIINKNFKKTFVNTQLNAFTRGYQSMFSYKSAYAFVINEGELRSELRDKLSSTDDLVNNLRKKIKFRYIAITKGKFGGSLYKCKNNKISKINFPAFNQNPTDSIGAGDTFLSILSACLSAKINDELSCFFASLGSFHSTTQLGNNNFINKNILRKYLVHMFN